MNKDKAIQLLERLQDPEPYEPMLTKDAYDAIQMAIDALENQKSVCEEYCEYEDCEAEKMVVQSLSSLYPLKEFEEIAIDKVLDAVKKPKRIRGRWIPVTENTLPDKNRVVVVCGEKGTWDYGMYRGYCNSNVHLWEWKKKTLKWVYWWMYKEDALTEPYKGVTT